MTLPALATFDDVAGRAPELSLDADQVSYLLDDASALVRSYASQTWVDESDALSDVPDGVPGLVATMVIRALRNPAGVTQETTGPFNVSYGTNAADRLYLTKSEKALLKGGSQSAFSVTMGTEETSWLGTVPEAL